MTTSEAVEPVTGLPAPPPGTLPAGVPQAAPADAAAEAGRLVEACPDGLWVLDAEGRTTYANDRMAHLLGVDPASMPGLSAYDVVAPDSQPLFRPHLERMGRAHPSSEDQECCLLRPDGTRVWARLRHSPLPDDDGVVRTWLHRLSDLPAGQREIEELQRREQQFAEVQRLARVGSWSWDRATQRLTASAELYEFYGIEPGAMGNSFQGFLALVHPDDRARASATIMDSWREEGVFSFDFRLTNDAGVLRWFRSRGRAWHDENGHIVRLVGTSQDITEIKEHENALGFLGAMGRAANEAATLAEALLAASEMVRPFAQWPSVVVSFPKRDGVRLFHLDPEWQEQDPEQLAAARSLAEQVSVDRTLVARALPGRSVLVAGPVAVRDRLACVLVVDTQSTAQPRPLDQSYFEQTLTLLGQVAEREWAAEQLAQARDEALAASRAKSDFLATMSHEIRTPLNGVIGLSELLGSTDLTPHQRRLSSGVDQAGRTLLALVNDILDLSKIEAGRLELEEIEFDPMAMIEQSVGLVTDRAREKQLELVVTSTGETPSAVYGDAVRFGQVVTNLAANAVKFTPAGEVVVRLGAERDPEPGPGQAEGGLLLRVEVTDTGIGIAADAAERLFEAFSQADSSTTREYGGTGLGLAISRRIVEAMGGEIGVTSEPGAGSTFWFTTRLRTDSTAPSERAPQDLVAGLRVLVVDDNETNRLILTEKLLAWRVAVTATASAYEALMELDTAQRHGAAYDVVLMDYMMPGADGEQLARIVRAESRHDRTRLALLSSATEPTADFLRDAGIDVYLAKPVLPSRLLDTLTRLGGRPEHVEEPLAPVPARGDGGLGRVLVVEDNPVNQLVAEGILQRSGYDVHVAENGALALQALADDDSFDVVLMDCQMPVMDGYAATRAIREREGPGRRVPIVAMTAAVTSEERQRCVTAGMDDFLSKPVDVARLEETLARWRRAPRVEEPVLDPDRLTELRASGSADDDLLLRLIGRFHERAYAAAAELAAATDAGSADRVDRASHDLRGGAANLGLVRLSSLCHALEEDAAGGRLPDPASLARLDAEIARAVTRLAEHARTLG